MSARDSAAGSKPTSVTRGRGRVFQTGRNQPLESVETVAGTKQRLKNLGFYAGPVDEQLTERLRESVRMYQRERGLPPTGRMNEETARVLREEHRA